LTTLDREPARTYNDYQSWGHASAADALYPDGANRPAGQPFGSGRDSMPMQSRRRFLTNAAFAGAACLLRAPPAPAAQGALETTTVRIGRNPAICLAPTYVSEELLRAEGFTDIRYVEAPTAAFGRAIGRGDADFGMSLVISQIQDIDADVPIVTVAGVHVGCYELFAQQHIRHIGELKGKRVAAFNPALLNLIAAQVGLNPAADFDWVNISDPSVNPLELFVQSKIDAYLAFPPHPQELRARGIGHVLVSTTVDQPWSQYFCCTLMGNRHYVRDHPVATKRALRAILKAADFCATQPERAAHRLVDRGFTARYDYALQTLNDVPYDKWREYDAEDTIRFYALRLRENGLIKSTPQQIIADGTDWRFFNELKSELKV
jgi:NitT/TauT family transport system substrate-binding protein